ncbi:MAG TPA: SRPBCC domain-containing protein [Candidatus Dormibacteraeota bacterium]|jgi:uncharacterized protein YndB with AHSA1/START domain|nr:SRPBCC domain-containing protein [Candidatus Dormibacteraeota bacterium]
MSSTDRIEREITISAPPSRVWALVSEPGWWISDGHSLSHEHRQERGLEIVDHPGFGPFAVRVESIEPERYAAFRWASEFRGQDPGDGNSTLVEIWLSESDGATVLRVVESGFASLSTSEEARRKAFEGNTAGWRQMTALVRAEAEGSKV